MANPTYPDTNEATKLTEEKPLDLENPQQEQAINGERHAQFAPVLEEDKDDRGQAEEIEQAQEVEAKKLEEDMDAEAKKIGGKYTKHEFAFVFTVGVVLSFNAGYINGSCMSGLIIPGAQLSVAGVTGTYTVSALALANGDVNLFSRLVCMILSTMFGSFISGAMTPNATPHRIEPSYGPTFLVGAVFLIIASVLSLSGDDRHFFYFAAAANGVQNGMSSIYSANLIRSTHLTGTTTDIGLFAGQLLRGNRKNLWKLAVLICLATSFWLGGLISFYATKRFTTESLLFNAGLFVLIGLSLIVFLVHELHVSVSAVLMGTWMWSNVFDKLEDQLRAAAGDRASMMSKAALYRSTHFGAFFDTMEAGTDKEIDASALYDALSAAGIQISKPRVKAMVQKADADGNGRISRDEWIDIAKSATKKHQSY